MSESGEASDKGKLTEELIQEIAEDLKIPAITSTLQLKELCRKSATLTQKYTEIYYEYKRKMKRLKVEMSKHEGEMFRKIRNDGYDGLTITSSSDIFTLIKNDAKYVKIKKLLDEFEIAVDFLERTINNFKDRSWKLRDLVEIEKLEHL